MTKLKGKVKSIELQDMWPVPKDTYVYHKGLVCKVLDGTNTASIQIETVKGGIKTYHRIAELKTLVVEYEVSLGEKQQIVSNPNSLYIATPLLKQLPLKYSQWQSAIDNGEVDSNKEIEWEEFTINAKRLDLDWVRGAKIIPQKKRMYSEEEVAILLEKFVKEGWRRLPTREGIINWLKQTQL